MKKAFTLIELLVVIAIIGSLSALLLPNYMGVRERARDGARKSDLKQIQKAFEMYKQDQTVPAYPADLPTAGSEFSYNDSVYMKKFPTDPSPGKSYYYSRTTTINYTLCTCLENEADPDAITSNCSVCTSCSSGPCYLVTEP